MKNHFKRGGNKQKQNKGETKIISQAVYDSFFENPWFLLEKKYSIPHVLPIILPDKKFVIFFKLSLIFNRD
jgi:hypothetical protein